MSLRVVGAGVGRTGTHSLKIALEQLLGGPCYHMIEVFGRPDDIPAWTAAARGDADWRFLDDYVAAVDWPACGFWRELSEANPDAIVVLSTRSSAEAWWKSANDTIFQVMGAGRETTEGWPEMIEAVFEKHFTTNVLDKDAAIAAYERHNADVRATADPARLVEWQPGDGWQPLCDALGVPVPDAPFPHVNTTEEFRAMTGLEAT